MVVERIGERGWARFPADARSLAWAKAARTAALIAVKAPEMAQWHQCEGTWFVGLDALPNDTSGALPGGPPLAGPALDALGELPALHRAQVSVTYPGYPRPRTGESEAGFRYRQNRDAAHVDGIIAHGPTRRRFVTEPHAFILGLPLSVADPDAAPLVVWEGSHVLMRAALIAAMENRPGEEWSAVDVTEVYNATRRRIFETCRRVVLHGAPGEAYLLHRLVLHGVAPWAEEARAAPEGRMIAYFRPAMPGGTAAWLTAP